MASAAGLFDFEYSKRAIFDVEVGRRGIGDFELEAAAAAGTLFTQGLAGTVTPAGALLRTPQLGKGGTLPPAGALAKLTTQASRTGTLTPTGALLKQAQRALAGTISSSGALTLAKVALLAVAGTLTPAGALVRAALQQKVGTLTPAGALAKLTTPAPRAGTITPAGSLLRSKQATVTLAGAITPTGALGQIRVAVKTLTGTLTPAATLIKAPAKALAGTLTPTGALARAFAGVRTVAGTLAPTGALIKQTQKLLTLVGTITPVGTVTQIKVAVKALAGTLTPSGALGKLVTQFHRTGTITPAGALAKQAQKLFAGTLTPSGALTRAKQAAQGLAGILTPSGVATSTKVAVRALAGTLTPTGTLRRTAAKALLGTVTPVGVVVRQMARRVVGTLTPTSAVLIKVVTQFHRVGTLTPVGALATLKGVTRAVAGTLTSTGTLRRATVHALTGRLTPVAVRVRAVVKGVTGRVTPTGLVGGSQTGPAIDITTTVLPDAVSGVLYSQTIATSGGTGTRVFSLIGGTLPPGLTLSPSGVVAGTPPLIAPFTPGTLADAVCGVFYSQPLGLGTTSYPFTVRVVDSVGTSDVQAYTVALLVGATTWTLVAGALPPGLGLDPSGVVTGTPGIGTLTPTTLPPVQAGVPYAQRLSLTGVAGFYQFQVQVTSNGLTTRHYYQMFVTADPAVYTVVAGVLPVGLSLALDGVLAGTATAEALVIRPTTLPPATVDVGYAQRLTVEGVASTATPITVRATTHGVSVDQAYTVVVVGWDTTTRPTLFSAAPGTIPRCVVCYKDGLLAGPPMRVGTWTFTVRARDGVGHTLAQTYTLVVT